MPPTTAPSPGRPLCVKFPSKGKRWRDHASRRETLVNVVGLSALVVLAGDDQKIVGAASISVTSRM